MPICFLLLFIKGRVNAIEVFAVQVPADLPKGLAEALEMVNLSLTQKLDRIPHIGVADQPQEVIIGGARLLFRGRALNNSRYYSSLNFINRQASRDFAFSVLYNSF